jgi:hypothetical protein
MTDIPDRDPAPAPAAPSATPAEVGSRFLRYLPFITVAHFIIGLPALIASLALAYFAFVQADATRKMQTGGAMPFVTIGSSNVDDAGKPDISLSLTNNGVGPAILGPIEVRYRGKPVASPTALLDACCTEGAATGLSFSTSPSTGVAIRPGESLRFIGLPRTPANEATWQRFQRERWRLSIRSCYCSIFNDCWIAEGMQGVPRAVKQCPADWSLYREDASKRLGMTRN